MKKITFPLASEEFRPHFTWIWIRIRIRLKGWIRIRIKSMRTRNTVQFYMGKN
jgi:hypothetical protein